MASSDTLAKDESLPTILWNRRPVAKRAHSSDISSDEGAGGDEDYFAASRLYEYRWPPEQERAELYFLQEQVAEFLRIRGIQRKYPDLVRRNVDVPEKKYLMHKGVVTETQSNMGLVAVRSEDVLEVMSEDFPDKYQEYMAVVQEREFQNTLQRRILETRKIALMREQQVHCTLRFVLFLCFCWAVSVSSYSPKRDYVNDVDTL
ncbi:PHD finger protein 10 [Geodia barretti]|uniref:PHD finger protein 10 n=1 Tax=Geodia barretti TaxID=519541 RepID=A0AA35XD31_GEOBA|nr:PHD finger protein 10 [Geodia barretti]